MPFCVRGEFGTANPIWSMKVEDTIRQFVVLGVSFRIVKCPYVRIGGRFSEKKEVERFRIGNRLRKWVRFDCGLQSLAIKDEKMRSKSVLLFDSPADVLGE
jgi:hypothetical protein